MGGVLIFLVVVAVVFALMSVRAVRQGYVYTIETDKLANSHTRIEQNHHYDVVSVACKGVAVRLVQ